MSPKRGWEEELVVDDDDAPEWVEGGNAWWEIVHYFNYGFISDQIATRLNWARMVWNLMTLSLRHLHPLGSALFLCDFITPSLRPRNSCGGGVGCVAPLASAALHEYP